MSWIHFKNYPPSIDSLENYPCYVQPEVWVSTGWQIEKIFLLVALVVFVVGSNPKLRVNEVFLTLTVTVMTAEWLLSFAI